MQLSDAEWKVMNVIWRKHPASTRDVLERLEGQPRWAYTTVKTLLTRLVDKGVLELSKRGNTSLFAPLVTRSAARRLALQSLVNKAFDGAFAPLVQFLMADERLSARDRAEIEQMIARQPSADASNPTMREAQHDRDA